MTLQLEQYFNDEKVLLLKIPALVCFVYYVSDHNHKSFVVRKAFVRCLVNTGAWQKNTYRCDFTPPAPPLGRSLHGDAAAHGGEREERGDEELHSTRVAVNW